MNDDIIRRLTELRSEPKAEVGMIVIHKDKGTIYKIVKIDDKFVKIERVDDPSKSFRLKSEEFFNVYKPLSKKEAKQLKSSEKTLKTFGIPVTGDNIEMMGGEAPGIFLPPDPRVLNSLILDQETITEIDTAVALVSNREVFRETWMLEDILEQNKCILNFYGPSGTGKTLAARYISAKLKKPIFQATYDDIISKWNGDTAKNIARVFKVAKKAGAILLLDEADTLLSRRISMNGSNDQSWVTSVNQNRNVLMQEIDRFDGIMITTTNFFDNYDPALLRRIMRHIRFKLPNKDQIVLLFKKHIPNMDRVPNVDFNKLAIVAKGLSGGDIRNVCLNAMERASLDPDPTKWIMTKEHLEIEIESVKNSRLDNGRRNSLSTIN